jgi:hypothetical protein
MAPIPEIPAGSVEYVRAQVAATSNGQPYDPTSDVVEMAFKSGSTAPEESDWKPAAWESDTVSGPPVYRAMCLVGPGAVELDPDTWRVWVRVTTALEQPVRPAGFVKIY